MRKLAAAAASVLLGACVSSDSMPVGPTTFPARPEDHPVEIFVLLEAPVALQKSIAHLRTPEDIPEGAQVIGRIDVRGVSLADWKSVVQEAEKEARLLGGDGLVIDRWGSVLEGVESSGEATYTKDLACRVLRYHP